MSLAPLFIIGILVFCSILLPAHDYGKKMSLAPWYGVTSWHYSSLGYPSPYDPQKIIEDSKSSWEGLE